MSSTYTPPLWSSHITSPCRLIGVRKGSESREIDLLAIKKCVVYLGRDLTAEIPIKHDTVSRRHCLVQTKAPCGLYLVDLGSTHGTFVNKQRVSPHTHHELKDGDVVQLGVCSECFLVSIPSEDEMENEEEENIKNNAKPKRSIRTDAMILMERELAADNNNNTTNDNDDDGESEEECGRDVLAVDDSTAEVGRFDDTDEYYDRVGAQLMHDELVQRSKDRATAIQLLKATTSTTEAEEVTCRIASIEAELDALHNMATEVTDSENNNNVDDPLEVAQRQIEREDLERELSTLKSKLTHMQRNNKTGSAGLSELPVLSSGQPLHRKGDSSSLSRPGKSRKLSSMTAVFSESNEDEDQ
eukprot:PhM_4_TR8377/c0_g1_i2/m.66000